MSNVLELGMLHVMGHHAVLGWSVGVSWYRALFVFIVLVVAVFLAHKVLWTLVFMRAAILRDLSVSFYFSAALCPG
jgi:hypothetical protein